VKGGAFGFRVSSINKLVDTKSVDNTTLLHFLERTVVKHFPDMEEFLDELEAPAEAHRVNLQDVRKGLTELRDGLKRIKLELTEHFSDVEALPPEDRYGKKMFRFAAEASDRLADLVDNITLADANFNEVLKYYGEDDRVITSTEFYGIFKTFVTSYKKCRMENQNWADERAQVEKRRRAAEEARATRVAALAKGGSSEIPREDMDTLLAKLRAGDSVGRKTRNRSKLSAPAKSRPSVTAVPEVVEKDEDKKDGDTADMAKNMLAALKKDGFTISTAPAASGTSPNASQTYTSRRSRLRAGMRVSGSVSLALPMLESTFEAGQTIQEDDGAPAESNADTDPKTRHGYNNNDDERESQAYPTLPSPPSDKDEQVSPIPS